MFPMYTRPCRGATGRRVFLGSPRLTGYEAVVAETAREFGEKETGEYETEAEQ